MLHSIHSLRAPFDRRSLVLLGRATTRASALLGVLALACQSDPATSSSSNWVVCEELADCEGVVGAVACVEGYCVDDSGDRVEAGGGAAGSGGTSGSGGASPGSGGAGQTGGSPGSGGEAMGGQGASPGTGGSGSGGEATGGGGATSADACGDGPICQDDEICVVATTVTGPSETTEYLCVADPCAGEELSCDCAAPACELSDGRSRLCFVAIAAGEENIDILCQDQAQ